MGKKQGDKIIPVIFRIEKKGGAVVAVFPTLFYHGKERWYEVWCYAHVGQHSEMNYTYYQFETKPATEKQYAKLLKELEGQGYRNLKVYKKWLYGGKGYKNALTQ